MVLAWAWMKAELTPAWRKITRRRHRTELRALRSARSMAPLAIFPIFLTVGGWFFLLAGLPSLILFLLTQGVTALGGIGIALGVIFFGVQTIFSIVALGLIAPWFFRWYFISVGLMLGRTGMADRKESELIMAIAAAETRT